MSDELISILVLIAVFLVATTTGINMGVLGIVAAFGVGTALGVSEDDIFAGFPGDLFVILVGVTFLFAIASNNGTVDWLVHAAVRAVRGRTAAIPWVMFLVTAILTASGAVVPGAVAIVAPIGLGFAVQYGINPVLMG
jgi:di/tricarboxylate transporter